MLYHPEHAEGLTHWVIPLTLISCLFAGSYGSLKQWKCVWHRPATFGDAVCSALWERESRSVDATVQQIGFTLSQVQTRGTVKLNTFQFWIAISFLHLWIDSSASPHIWHCISHFIPLEWRFFVTGRLPESICQTNVSILVNIEVSKNKPWVVWYLVPKLYPEFPYPEIIYPFYNLI